MIKRVNPNIILVGNYYSDFGSFGRVEELGDAEGFKKHSRGQREVYIPLRERKNQIDWARSQGSEMDALYSNLVVSDL